MAMAIALVVVVIGSLLFHYLSPWWATPLSSNWRQMDDTLTITFIITGIFFVLVNLFVVYTLLRYRHREGHRAAYEPDNRKLEGWLIGLTTVGIMALLAPGLLVYAQFINAPRDAMVVEVLGQQWQWRFRLPGPDGKLGVSDPRFITASNPFGLDPDDPVNKDNVVVNASELHLPLGKPVRILARSVDVLHDFYVPEFRARMNMVPGMVTSFWFTPTRAGKYEILCAQLCGVGHFNMRGHVVVDEPVAYQAWLAQQPTFAVAMAKPAAPASVSAGAVRALPEQGKALAQSKGCTACHSADGSKSVGPTWKDLYGKQSEMESGKTQTAGEAYLKRSITEPQADIVKGYPPIMPKIPLTDEELAALVAYIESLGGAQKAPAQNTQR